MDHAELERSMNAFLRITKDRCPVIVYVEPVLPALRCVIEHRLASGVSWWAVYRGQEVGASFVGYRTGERTTETEKKSRGPGGIPFEPREEWDEVPPFRNPVPLDAPVEYVVDMTPEAISLIRDAKLLFYSYLAFDDGLVDPAFYRKEFGDYWIPGLLNEEDHDLFLQLRALHAAKPFADRDQAYARARELMQEHWRNKRPFGLSGGGLNWFQAASFTKQKRWDHELATGNYQVLMAFLRGVSRQRDIPFIAYAAPWAYNAEGIFGMPADPETLFGKVLNCPAYASGKTEHLLERQWYYCWFSGAAAVILESARIYLFRKTDRENEFEPSRLGRIAGKLNRIAWESEFQRGMPWRPACILLDEKHGWNMSTAPDARYDRPLMERRKAWGVFDYTHPDVMTDNFFGAIFPGYETSNQFGGGQGDLTVTPYGDSFDVLLSDADLPALRRYPVTFLLGRPEPDGEFRDRLRTYVEEGGTLVLSVAQVDFGWQDFLGVRFRRRHNISYTALGPLRFSDHAEWNQPRLVWKDHRYRYVRLEPEGAEVLAVTHLGDPLVLRRKQGRGEVYLVTAEWMQEYAGLKRPYGLLEIARFLIGRVMEPHQRLRVRGPQLHYMVNETGEGLSVMLLNNRPELWHGWISFPGRVGAGVREWYQEEEVRTYRPGGDLSLQLTIPPYGLRILSVEPDKRSP